MNNKDILLKQKHLNMSFYAMLMMVITTIQWITLDMYLPALPVLTEEFGTSVSMLNISVNAGIVTTAVGTLFSGTISDRYGRKPVMLFGLLVSAICNLLCVFAGNVLFLSIMRGLAGLGSGAALTMTSATLKDSFSGKRFVRAMTLLQSIAAVGPLIAPTLGSLIINVSSWHGIFYFLAAATALTALPMLISTETWPPEQRHADRFTDVLVDASQMVRSPAFTLLLGITGLLTIPVWAYIAVSPYIYINEFGISNILYGILYGVGAGMSILAPFLNMFLVRRFTEARAVTVTLIMALAGGILLLTAGSLHPGLFLLSIVPIMLAEGVIRPLTMVVLLEQYSHAAGSASALIQFFANLVGILGTTLATLHWSSMIHGTGVITLGCALLAIACWRIMKNMKLLKSRLRY